MAFVFFSETTGTYPKKTEQERTRKDETLSGISSINKTSEVTSHHVGAFRRFPSLVVVSKVEYGGNSWQEVSGLPR